ncbi:MAG: VanZ family protein [Lachnospiraceae bacterium]|nr:VanZ family protein [Lachnospiraceae bacterium]
MSKRKFLNIIFIIYIVLLIVFVVIKLDFNYTFLHVRNSIKLNREFGFWNINLYPFKTTLSYIRRVKKSSISIMYVIEHLAGNVIAFLPMGFFIPLLTRHKLLYSMLICLGIIVLIEVIQFVFMIGYADVDDIILNMLGCFAGYGLYRIFMNKGIC